ncbi:cell wall biogenesis protein, partial [Penicillium subrubescens]|uniref:cell wall biogenesis protein n=1 Tax=Penicillium subrubescens TaxID=1316194 RepID=UPI0025454122
IGAATPSFSQQITDIQRLLQDSGLTFVTHTTGTTIESKDSPTRKTIEGSWDQVVQLIGMAHTLTHQQGIARVQTDIRIETRY